MRVYGLLALNAVVLAFDYKSLSVTAPRRVVKDADVDAKFEEVNKPYALFPVDGPAAPGLGVLAQISLTAPAFSWTRDNYNIELLEDQVEPFGSITTKLCAAGVGAGGTHAFSFPVDIDLRLNLSPDFNDLEQGTTCACVVNVRRVFEKREDPRTPEEKKAIIGDRLRARAVKDSEALADALLQTAIQEALGPDWRAKVARDEDVDEAAVPAFLREACDVQYFANYSAA